jgi:hypothetical protein
MKKSLILTGLTLIGLLATNSCGDKFLERTPQGQYSPAVTATPSGVEALLVGTYGLLDGVGANTTAWHGAVSNWVFGGLTSGDAYKGTDAGDQPEQTSIERFVWITTNDHLRGKWRALFEGIIRSNDVLQTLAKTEGFTGDRKKQIEGEARFLRGWYYFEAKKIWNKLPYIDDKIYNSADPNSVKISNEADIWPKIEDDFKAAIENLPENFDGEPGRADKWAAKAMLAKSYLFQGFDISTGAAKNDKLQAAKAILDEIIASGKFRLMDNYGDNFSANPSKRNNAESLFEVQYSLTATADGGGNQGDGLAWPYNAGPGGCCGFYQPSQNLVNAHKTDPATGLPLLDTFNDSDVKSDEGVTSDQPFSIHSGTVDPRLDHNVGRRYIPYRDWGIHPGQDWVRDQKYAGPYSPKKHNAEKAYSGTSGWVNLNANNYRYLRYSHILLWAAEVEVEIGDLEKARAYVNQIRTRAGNDASIIKGRVTGFNNNNPKDPVVDNSQPAANYLVKTYTAPWTDKATARKAVRFEERLEFAMEGTRFFDLVRWGIAEDVINNQYLPKERVRRTYLNGASFKKGTNEYFPIPQAEITNSIIDGKPAYTQNPGY